MLWVIQVLAWYTDSRRPGAHIVVSSMKASLDTSVIMLDVVEAVPVRGCEMYESKLLVKHMGKVSWQLS